MRIILLLVVVAWYAENLDAASVAQSDRPSPNFKASVGTFTKKSFKVIAQENHENFVYSPLGASMVLTMTAFGASGETASQMRSGLALPVKDSITEMEINSMLKHMRMNENYELRSANMIFVTDKCNPTTGYQRMFMSAFDSQPQTVDFGNPEKTSSNINDWVAKETNHRINNFVSPDSISGATELLLVNAVYFKGNWELKFKSSLTTLRKFHVDGTTVKDVPTMYNSDYYRHNRLNRVNATFIELPYAAYGGDALSMYVILPDKKDGLAELVSNFDKISLEDLMFGRNRMVNVYLPKFKIESSIDLRQPLINMGFTNMFTTSADFSGISNCSLLVSGVTQKASIEVNEEGSEAAAASGVGMEDKSWNPIDPRIPIDFDVDHPFMAVIMTEEQIPLFIATVNDPAGSRLTNKLEEDKLERRTNPIKKLKIVDWVFPDY